jgi:hypothetical protein
MQCCIVCLEGLYFAFRAKLYTENKGTKLFSKRPEFTYPTTDCVTLKGSKFQQNCCDNLQANTFQTAFEGEKKGTSLKEQNHYVK